VRVWPRAEPSGHEVALESEREKALARPDLADFDLLVSDLIDHDPVTEPESVRSFKMGVTSLHTRRTIAELRDIIEKTLLLSCSGSIRIRRRCGKRSIWNCPATSR